MGRKHWQPQFDGSLPPVEISADAILTAAQHKGKLLKVPLSAQADLPLRLAVQTADWADGDIFWVTCEREIYGWIATVEALAGAALDGRVNGRVKLLNSTNVITGFRYDADDVAVAASGHFVPFNNAISDDVGTGSW